jgi:hypothetical protein
MALLEKDVAIVRGTLPSTRRWVSILTLASVLAVAWPAVAGASATSLPGARPGPGGVSAAGAVAGTGSATGGGAELGAYEWDDATWWPDPSAYADTLTRLKGLGVTTLYVDITEAVNLVRDHSSELGGFETAFGELVEEADADGVRVDAIGGDPTWATDRTGPAELLAVVSAITAAFPGAALDGVQFDVEPWGLKSWGSHRAGLERHWLGFIRSTVTAWHRDGLEGRLGFTVPFWFDGGAVPRVTFGGSRNYPFQLALGILSSLDTSVLNVMAYRNSTAGPNGSIDLFASNMAAAVAAGSHTELLAGQETGDVRPSDTTFYGTSCTTFDAATAQIADAFDGDTLYEGVAVDDVESLEALCPE